MNWPTSVSLGVRKYKTADTNHIQDRKFIIKYEKLQEQLITYIRRTENYKIIIMGVKIYNKRGSKNYKEKRMIEEIESAIGTELENNPELAEKWVPASNFDEFRNII